MKKYYYQITTHTHMQSNDLGMPDLGNTARWGVFTNWKDAYNAVVENRADIWETCYDYAIIETKILNFMCGETNEKWVFKYNIETGKYEEIPVPDCIKYSCGF